MAARQLITERFTRSEKLLNLAVGRGALSENGKAALIAAVDPFHDDPILDLRGWPDAETQPSVVRCVRQSMTFRSLADGDNVMIYTWPILNAAKTRYATRRNAVIDNVTDDVSTNFYVGPVTVEHFTSTTNMTLSSGTFEWNSSLNADYLRDSCRILGMGVEVYDVTAEIYKQGTLTAFCVPQSTVEPETFVVKNAGGPPTPMTKTGVGMTPVLPCGVDVIPLKRFPNDLGTIMQLEGTKQWDCSQGCYTVVPFHGRDNFSGQPIYCTPGIYRDQEGAERVDYLNTSPLNIGPWAEPLVANDFPVFLANKFAPMHSKGILLSGLNQHSTFTINVIYYLESFPAPDNVSLITLARPSAALDEVALEMISVATQRLPIAVPVDWNGLGDWFAEAVAEIAPYLGAAATGLGFAPGAAAATAAAEAAKAYMASDSYQATGGFFDPKKPTGKPKQPAQKKAVTQSKATTEKKSAKPRQNAQLPKISQMSDKTLRLLQTQIEKKLAADKAQGK